MKDKFIRFYMNIAGQTALLSSAERLRVGAVIVKDDNIIAFGYNGTPSGWSNCCEEKVYLDYSEVEYIHKALEEFPLVDNGGRYKLKTNPEVLHAEANAIAKLSRSAYNGVGATIFCTHMPCLECAKLIYQCGIKSVWYENVYRSASHGDGEEFLLKAGIKLNYLPF